MSILGPHTVLGYEPLTSWSIFNIDQNPKSNKQKSDILCVSEQNSFEMFDIVNQFGMFENVEFCAPKNRYFRVDFSQSLFIIFENKHLLENRTKSLWNKYFLITYEKWPFRKNFDMRTQHSIII